MMPSRFLTALGGVIFAAVLAAPLSGQTVKPMATSHTVEDREDCLMCHTGGMFEDVPQAPANHEGRVNEQCLWCHAADSPMLTVDPKPVSHEPKEGCTMCHTGGMFEDVPQAPANHEGRGDEVCSMCHKAAEA